MKKLLALALLFGCLHSSAQKPKYTFQSNMQFGLLEGQRGSAFQLQTVNGLQFNTWFAGLGAGLDYYHTRSIPLFLNLRKSFFSGEKTPFIFLLNYFNGKSQIEEIIEMSALYRRSAFNNRVLIKDSLNR